MGLGVLGDLLDASAAWHDLPWIKGKAESHQYPAPLYPAQENWSLLTDLLQPGTSFPDIASFKFIAKNFPSKNAQFLPAPKPVFYFFGLKIHALVKMTWF